jgi:solute carrier family 15 (oligopeptide transporter), member 1
VQSSVVFFDVLQLILRFFALVGLIVAMVGVGCIKSNSNTFAANQYHSEHADQLGFYFTMQYFCMKSGSIVGRFLNPMMRQDVKCFGVDGCFPLSFGVPAIAMILSALILIAGKSFYTHKPPSGNEFIKVCACILVSIINYGDEALH